MKDAIKVFGLIVVGLLCAIIIYPFFHEMGHSITAMLVGADVVEFNLFPIPNVLCNVNLINKTGIILTGIGGMLMPLFLTVLIHPKGFWLWYSALIIKGISLLSFIISAVAVILYKLGIPMINEDITQVLDMWNDGWMICLLGSLLFSVLTIIGIARKKPLKRLLEYFEIQDTKKQMAASA